jgi:hypothetical protein
MSEIVAVADFDRPVVPGAASEGAMGVRHRLERSGQAAHRAMRERCQPRSGPWEDQPSIPQTSGLMIIAPTRRPSTIERGLTSTCDREPAALVDASVAESL